MADVFLSFIFKEKGVAKCTKELLESAGSSVSMAGPETIFAGEDWLQRIKEEIKSSKVVVAMLSERSVSQPWVNFEAGAASFAKKKIIPVCYCGLAKGELPEPYRSLRVQAIDLKDEPHELIAAVSHHLKKPIPAQTRGGLHESLLRAIEECDSRRLELKKPSAQQAMLTEEMKLIDEQIEEPEISEFRDYLLRAFF